MSYKLNFLWPYADGSLAEAAYEVANGRTFAYRKMWAGIFLQIAAQQSVRLTRFPQCKGCEYNPCDLENNSDYCPARR